MSFLKGKTTRSSPKPVKHDKIAIPKELYQKHKDITYHMDTMYVNGIPFLTSVGYPIYYRGCKSMDSTTHKEYYKTSDKLFRMHNHAGFKITTIECDGEAMLRYDGHGM